ncbi:hypothetical protein [Ornithinimicrobium sp. W1665]|uniref:hypothetical protein n=1 Tax=Ornithinimicrobium sp. W1665 TaxID=3416666 RepID=UPI003D6BFE67
MGLSTATSRLAARHAHALVVEVPGWGRTRMHVERAVLARGWQLAQSPADADVLIVCGVPGSRLTQAVDLVWHQMPGPRVRVEVLKHSDTVGVLDDAPPASSSSLTTSVTRSTGPEPTICWPTSLTTPRPGATTKTTKTTKTTPTPPPTQNVPRREQSLCQGNRRR